MKKLDRRLPNPPEENPLDWIFIEEANEHNLKSITTKVPRNRFVVFTGLSGSGKSSLAIDTLFAEGQRRFVESLSSYARQFLGKMEKPDVKSIRGLSPAICIEQKTGSSNPRSTVSTVTEIMDYLRILYASVGTPHCPNCGKEVNSLSVQQIVNKITDNEEGRRFRIVAPIVIKEKGTFTRLFNELKKEGYNRLDVDGDEYLLDDEIPKLDKKYKHNISAVIDRLRLKPGLEGRITEAVEISMNRAEGRVRVDWLDDPDNPESVLYHEFAGCIDCGISIGELNPRLFSFNSPLGACQNCTGLGFVIEVDPDLLIEDESLSISAGGMTFFNADSNSWSLRQIGVVLDHFGGSLDTPIRKLPKKALNAVLFGSDEKIKFSFESDSTDKSWKYESERSTEGILNTIRRRHKNTKSNSARKYYERFMRNKSCPECAGKKLKKAALGVLIGGKNIMEVNEMSVIDAYQFFNELELSERDIQISRRIMDEVQGRLNFLQEVGLEYLTLDRKSASLSGGESQRIRLATQVGSKLVGVLYVLDEPSIGLHQRDNERLLNTFFELRDIGNSVIVIEHDDETINSADFILDLGPEAGIHGGEVVAAGSPEAIKNSKRSITGKYLRGEYTIDIPENRRQPNGAWLSMKKVKHNNLKSINVDIPLGVMTVITGVSGSGKSSLITGVLWKVLANEFHGAKERPGKYGKILGMEHLDKVIMINQSPIGRTPRSNPATYTKIFDHIRAIYAEIPAAKLRGYSKGRFSFNVKGGRCEPCSGNGYNKIEMSFMGTVFIECDICKGRRFNNETLEITYKGKNISDVLSMSIEEAHEFFINIPKVRKILDTLLAVGCGYLKLGQSATTLSGGEAQRIKLSRELGKRTTGQTLILLDEPTTGLSKHDVKKLLEVLHTLVDKGNSILIIEHNMDVIKNADYIIDLGPEGGINGGKIIAKGAPEKIISSRKSHTARYLRAELK